MSSPQMEKIVESIAQLKAALIAKSLEDPDEPRVIIDRETFGVLLSGVPSFRRLPGIPEHAGFDGIYHCKTEEDAEILREHFKSTLGVVDAKTLEDEAKDLFHTYNEYYDFACEWDGHPNFSLDEIGERGREAYIASRDFAFQLRDLVTEHGFLAWDIGERVMLIRAACACGLISEDDYARLISEEVKIAAEVFDNFIDYATSALAGCVYFMFVNMDRHEEGGLFEFLEINMKFVSSLFESGVWPLNGWCAKKYKSLAIRDDQIQSLLGEEYRNITGVASDRILCDGYRIGVMVREIPVSSTDSGWRFFAGDEDPEYLQDRSQFGSLDLNLIMNYAPDGVEFLKEPPGTFLVRSEETGKFIPLDKSTFMTEDGDIKH